MNKESEIYYYFGCIKSIIECNKYGIVTEQNAIKQIREIIKKFDEFKEKGY